jgi:hypothetical protein
VFDEMSAFFVDIVEKFKMLLTEIDKLPMGTDMKGSPLQVALEKEVQGMQSYLLQKQTEGGYLVAHWQMEVHERVSAGPHSCHPHMHVREMQDCDVHDMTTAVSSPASLHGSVACGDFRYISLTLSVCVWLTLCRR